MSSTPRRGGKRKDDTESQLDDDTPSRITRNHSAKMSLSSMNTKSTNRPSFIKKLRIEEIDKALNDSDNEFAQPRNIGVLEERNKLKDEVGNRRSSRVRNCLSYNEESSNKVGVRSTSLDTASKSVKVQKRASETTQSLERSCSEKKINKKYEVVKTDNKNRTRRKSANYDDIHLNDDHNVSEENEVNENEMQNANKNLSPRTRSKTPCRIPKPAISTPKRSANHFKDSNSPTKILKTPSRKSKISVDTPTKTLSQLNLNEPKTPTGYRTSSRSQKCMSKIESTLPNISNEILNEESRVLRSTRSINGINYRENDGSTSEEIDDSSDEYKNEETSSSGDSENDTDDSVSSLEIYSLKSTRKDSRKKNSTTNKKIHRNNLRTPKKVSMETPTKAFARLNLTPSMHRRTMNIIKPSTPLQEARAKLHVSVLPKSLPCREEQFNDIYTFLHTKLSDNSGGCIYISGVPGTGKTATVNEVIRCLNKSVEKGELRPFEFIDINGMKLSEPRQVYVQIWKQLTKQSTTWENAHKMLHDRFTKSNSKKNMTLLLVDELDLLCTKRQDVVYNLLDWPSKSGAKLVVVTIANTMDLPERVFMGKVTSRLGLSRLTFPPYNHHQLEKIVVSRLKGHNAFSGETVQLVARKVAAVSGDARRALDICRRATEIAEVSGRQMVSMIDIKQALDEMIASPKIQAIKHCSDMEKFFLEAVCVEVNRTGVEEVIFKNVYFQFKALCRINGEQDNMPNITEALSICARLGSWRLLLCDHSKMDIHQRLILNVSTDDVYFATQSIEA